MTDSAQNPQVDQVQDEWLQTNHLGSFAMGTPTRIAARKYHGLLIARAPLWEDPHHILSEVNEIVTAGERTYQLGAFQYTNTIYPNGNRHLVRFEATPEPSWEYNCDGLLIKRSFQLHPETNVIQLCYEITNAPESTRISIYPYFGLRNANQLQAETALLDGRIFSNEHRVLLRPFHHFPEIFMGTVPKATFTVKGFWNRRISYPEEAARGYAHQEDLFCPGSFEILCDRSTSFSFRAGLSNEAPLKLAFPKQPPIKDEGLRAKLERAANAFMIQPQQGYGSVIAGYPWFGEWGRDTFISFFGLTLARGLDKEAVLLLNTYASRLKNGLIPNILAKTPESSNIHSIDASLWFIRAVQQFEAVKGVTATKNWELRVLEILDALMKHRHKAVHVRPSGLLYASSKPRPLTWMDVSINGAAVTPRSPFAVDVNALFYNAVHYGLQIAKRRNLKDFEEVWTPLASSMESTFKKAFWLEAEGYLADAHTGTEPDTSLRPNQLLALSLPFRPVSKTMGRSILKHVRKHLLTPYGLRSLAPFDSHYRSTCKGGIISRDFAYHQGTVWPWLIGPYIDAVLFVEGPHKALQEVKPLLNSCEKHLSQACLGQISEIFDGDPPHTPRGAPAQAWSVAELLRIVVLSETLEQDINSADLASTHKSTAKKSAATSAPVTKRRKTTTAIKTLKPKASKKKPKSEPPATGTKKSGSPRREAKQSRAKASTALTKSDAARPSSPTAKKPDATDKTSKPKVSTKNPKSGTSAAAVKKTEPKTSRTAIKKPSAKVSTPLKKSDTNSPATPAKKPSSKASSAVVKNPSSKVFSPTHSKTKPQENESEYLN